MAEPVSATAIERDGDDERRSRLRTAPFVIGLVIAILAAGGVFANSLIGGDDDQPETAKSPDALPSVGAAPLKPKQGQTIAGAVYDKASPAVVSVRAGRGSGTGFLIG